MPCRNMFKTFCFHICKLKANGTPNSEKKNGQKWNHVMDDVIRTLTAGRWQGFQVVLLS